MRTQLFNLSIFSILVLSFSGCATTSINFDKGTKSLVLINEGEEAQVSNITSSKDNNKMYVVQNKGNSKRTTYIGAENSSCKVINVFEYLPLGMNRFYNSSVTDDLKHKYRGYKIKKYGQIYLANNSNRATLAFQTNGMHGVDSKTYIDISTKCLMKFSKKYQNDNKSIWYRPSKIIEN
ncbi:MAG: hypothetical protein U9R39_00010 [Campylobacterota bacterium]|nr:hypothetical protein [Campylobacterota bacterium]